MNLFYSPDISSNIYTLPANESKHCIKVLRLKIGDTVHLTDGKGNLFETKIIEDNIKKCVLEIINTQSEVGKRDFNIHIAIAPTKNINRLEWFLEKATETGIDQITPIICEHSERKIIKPERLNKVITAAMKQSLKAYHPVLCETTKFKDFIKKGFNGEKYIAYINEDYKDTLKELYTKNSNVLILIGPEGDFSKDEIKAALKKEYKPISLGESRLRTETAALMACFIVNFLNS